MYNIIVVKIVMLEASLLQGLIFIVANDLSQGRLSRNYVGSQGKVHHAEKKLKFSPKHINSVVPIF